MLISFIIVAKSEEEIKMDTQLLKKIVSTHGFHFEIIKSIGINPSKQRNKAAEAARADWLYFLDNDSLIDETTIDHFLIALKKFPDAKVIGGPSVLPNPAEDWQKAVQFVFSSDFGVGPLKSRYFSNGLIRKSNERELILCNMAIKKETFEYLGGFNENLYPNEENEFLKRLSKLGQVIYSPGQIVYRGHRENPVQLIEQMIGYGIGRTRHLFFSRDYFDYIYFLPMFALFLFIITVSISSLFFISKFIFEAYALILILQGLVFVLQQKKPYMIFYAVTAFISCHLGYALGLFMGFFDKKTRTLGDVKIKVEV